MKDLLEQRENGNDERKSRAEALRQKATELLSKIKRHNDDVESERAMCELCLNGMRSALKKNADSLDVELSSFRNGISVLSDRIDQVAKQIDVRVDYHATCDA